MSEYLSNRPSYYIDSLNRFIKSSHPLMLIIGQQGSGKNELLQDFLRQTHQELSVLKIHGNTHFTPHNLVSTMSDAWQFKQDETISNQREQFDYLLAQMRDKKKPYLLIINDAHELSISVLAALSHLSQRQESSEVALHIITAGNIELEEKVATLMTQMPPSLLLQPLSQKETEQYIRYRLAKLQKTNPITLSPEVINEIYTQSNGFPSIISHLTQKWLHQCILEKETITPPPLTTTLRKKLSVSFWEQHRVKIISFACLAVLGSAMLIQNHKKSLEQIFSAHQTKSIPVQHPTENSSTIVPEPESQPPITASEPAVEIPPAHVRP